MWFTHPRARACTCQRDELNHDSNEGEHEQSGVVAAVLLVLIFEQVDRLRAALQLHKFSCIISAEQAMHRIIDAVNATVRTETYKHAPTIHATTSQPACSLLFNTCSGDISYSHSIMACVRGRLQSQGARCTLVQNAAHVTYAVQPLQDSPWQPAQHVGATGVHVSSPTVVL